MFMCWLLLLLFHVFQSVVDAVMVVVVVGDCVFTIGIVAVIVVHMVAVLIVDVVLLLLVVLFFFVYVCVYICFHVFCVLGVVA